MPLAKPPNYDQEKLSKWIKQRISVHGGATELLAELDRLAVDGAGKIGKRPFEKIKLGPRGSSPLKNLSESRLKTILRYMKKHQREDKGIPGDLSELKAWASWIDPEELRDQVREERNGKPGPTAASNEAQIRALWEALGEFSSDLASLKRLVFSGGAGRVYSEHPFTPLLLDVLASHGIDPVKDLEKIENAASGVEEADSVVSIICGCKAPEHKYLAAVNAAMYKLCGKDWATPEIVKMVGAIALDRRISPEPLGSEA